MALLSGCQEGKATPRLMEIVCPKCGDIIEVFVGMGSGNAGKIVEEAKCEKCGHVIAEEKLVSEFEEA